MKNPFRRNSKAPKAKPKAQARPGAAKKSPPAINMRHQEPEPNEGDIYAELQNFDPESMYDYMEAYEYLELDEPEAAAKVDAVESDEELAEIIEDCDAYIAYFEGIKALCEAALGYEPSTQEDPAANMELDDLTDPEEEPEDESKTADKMKTAKSRRRLAGNKKPVSTDAYIKGIPDSNLRDFMANGEKQHAAYRNTMIKNIMVANRTWKQDELNAMQTNQLEKLITSMRLELPDYGIRGIQSNREEDKGYTPPTTNIFARKEKKAGANDA